MIRRLLSLLGLSPLSLDALARQAFAATQAIDRAMGRTVVDFDDLSPENRARYLAIAEAVARACGRRVA